MYLKRILVFLISTELCTIGMVLSDCFDGSLVDDYDYDGYILSTEPRFKRGLNDLGESNKIEQVRLIPEYLNLWEKLIPDMKTKLEIIKGNLFLPRSLENHSSDTVPPSFIRTEPVESSPGISAKENEREAYQELSMRPEAIFTEEPVRLEIATPEPYLVQEPGNQLNWKEGGGGGGEQVALNFDSQVYTLPENINPNLNEDIFNVNHLETETDSFKGGVRGCYSQCLRNCLGTSSAVHRPDHCESIQHAKPLIININSECLNHPSQRFSHGYGFQQKLLTNPSKCHSPPRRVHKYSSCLSDTPHFYY